MVGAVDKNTKSANASKIKKEATSKASAIHDRYEKASSEVKNITKDLNKKLLVVLLPQLLEQLVHM